MADTSPTIPRFPGGPDPTEPVPGTPVHGFDIAACARVAGRLAQRAEPRAATLARAGLDEARWTEIEATWMLRIATALLQNDTSLGEAYDAGFAAGKGPG
ncbi:hypothetical protein WME76_17900 [Sorangium sp. So ce119]|uniref:hypothetical protein n=1 Tax=Sorangium sp. So ce119 TaxID=3133279 RepID=UPI003F627433